MTQANTDQTPELRIYRDRKRCPNCGATRLDRDNGVVKWTCSGAPYRGSGWSDTGSARHEPVEMEWMATADLAVLRQLRRSDLDALTAWIDEAVPGLGLPNRNRRDLRAFGLLLAMKTKIQELRANVI